MDKKNRSEGGGRIMMEEEEKHVTERKIEELGRSILGCYGRGILIFFNCFGWLFEFLITLWVHFKEKNNFFLLNRSPSVDHRGLSSGEDGKYLFPISSGMGT